MYSDLNLEDWSLDMEYVCGKAILNKLIIIRKYIYMPYKQQKRLRAFPSKIQPFPFQMTYLKVNYFQLRLSKSFIRYKGLYSIRINRKKPTNALKSYDQ